MIYQAPEFISITPGNKSIFLAGTIDMGNSENWQQKVIDTYGHWGNVDIYNPRRDDWDSSWIQEFSNDQFYRQVKWEINAMKKCDIIVMYFLATSQSPITLLELGLFAASGKLRVCCEPGFWRRGNVEIVCEEYHVPFYSDFNKLLSNLTLDD